MAAPPNPDRPPPPARHPTGPWRLPIPVLVIAVVAVAVIGWAMPLLGRTLLGFLTIDLAVELLSRGRAGRVLAPP